MSVVTATVLASSTSADEFQALRPVTLHVRNTAGIPERPLSGAMREVVRLYSDIAVTLTWEEDADKQPLTIVVHVLNDSDVSDKDLLLAQLQAARTYQAIGITMRWTTGGADTDTYAPGIFHVRLHLLSGDRANRMASASNLNSDVLGLAVSRARLVYVWCNRIQWSVTPRLGNFAGVLGRVIAHELGHVLLPSLKRHSDTGIMRANMLVRADSPQFFTNAQGSLIRAFVAAGSQGGELPLSGAGSPTR